MNDDIIRIMALDLASGEQRNGMVCPKCNGGMHGDKSFGMTRNEQGILYNCFRAKCGFSGFLQSSSTLKMAVQPKGKVKIFSKPTRSISPEERVYLQNTYELSNATTYAYRYCDEMHRFIFPIVGANGQIGDGAKDEFKKGIGPKWIHYFHRPKEPKLHIKTAYHRHAIIVEDVLSADKLADCHIPSIALLGTELNVDNAIHIRNLGITELYLALDPDAVGKMKKIRDKYGLLFGIIEINFWKQDIKDTPKDELIKMYGKEH